MSSRQEHAHGRSRVDLPEEGTVLLLAPAIGRAEREACTDSFTCHDLGDARLIHVLYADSAADRFRRFEEHLGRHPDETAIIPVGAGGVAPTRGPEPPRSDYHVTSMSDPSDLTGLAMVLNEWLCRWADETRPLAVCLDSLSILLQYADLDRVFRFLHTLTGHLSEFDATAHFHMDPGAHDDDVVARFETVFDSVLEVDHDGRRRVRHS